MPRSRREQRGGRAGRAGGSFYLIFFRSTGSLIHRAALRFSQNYSAPPTARIYIAQCRRWHVLYVYIGHRTLFFPPRARHNNYAEIKNMYRAIIHRATSAGTE